MSNSLKDQMDFHKEFKQWYFKIVNEFKFDYQKDLIARDYLSQILIKKASKWRLETILKHFKNHISAKPFILIYGCGPSLEESVEILLKKGGRQFFKNCINLAANGASILLRENEIPIDAIFTDLDGITKSEFNYSNFNIVHSHGDNIEKLKLFENEILEFENIIATTQVEPLESVINPGGFTDGDRILYFLRIFLLPKHQLFLLGMDFKNLVGKYSKPKTNTTQEGNSVKIKKLRFAVKLIEWLIKDIKNEIYFVNSEAVSKKFKYITIEEFEEININ